MGEISSRWGHCGGLVWGDAAWKITLDPDFHAMRSSLMRRYRDSR